MPEDVIIHISIKPVSLPLFNALVILNSVNVPEVCGHRTNTTKRIKDSKIWYEREKDERTYKPDLKKRIELMTWSLEQFKNPNVCAAIESRINKTVQEINKKDSV